MSNKPKIIGRCGLCRRRVAVMDDRDSNTTYGVMAIGGLMSPTSMRDLMAVDFCGDHRAFAGCCPCGNILYVVMDIDGDILQFDNISDDGHGIDWSSVIAMVVPCLGADGVPRDAVHVGDIADGTDIISGLLTGDLLYAIDIEADTYIFNQYGGLFIGRLSRIAAAIPTVWVDCQTVDDWLDVDPQLLRIANI